jgi:hypothetical protein
MMKNVFNNRSIDLSMDERVRKLSIDTNFFNHTTAILTTVESLSKLVAGSISPGQKPTDFIESQIRLSSQVMPSDLTTSNFSLSVPQTAFEKYLNLPVSSVIVPTSKDKTGVTVSITSVHAGLYNFLNEEFNSNPLHISLSSLPCGASQHCDLHVSLQNSKSLSPSVLNGHGRRLAGDYHTKSCVQDDYSSSLFQCSDGSSLSIQCNGTAGMMKRQCPVTSYSFECNAISGSSVKKGSSSGCQVHSYTDTNVTCICSLQSETTTQYSHDEKYTVNYVSMLESTTQSFESTIESVSYLSASTVTESWISLVTIGVLTLSIAIALILSHYFDHEMKKIKPHDKKVCEGSHEKLLSVKKRRVEKKKMINMELELVENSLPKALSSRSFTDRCIDEIKHHHRWLGIVFYFSEDFPRILRVTSLATNMIIMLFMQSLTYNLTNPDDGSCKSLTNRADCQEASSPYDSGESKCEWISSTGKCQFIQPDSQIKVVLFVAVFCAVVSTPIALLVDWILLNIIASPTHVAVDSKTDDFFEEDESNALFASNEGTNRTLLDVAGLTENENKFVRRGTLTDLKSFHLLCGELKKYHHNLLDNERAEFDRK